VKYLTICGFLWRARASQESTNSAEDAALREAESTAYLAESRQQEQRWNGAYSKSIRHAANGVEKLTGEAKAMAQEQVEYLREVRERSTSLRRGGLKLSSNCRRGQGSPKAPLHCAGYGK
jgi:hypothetical protein